VCAPNWEGRTRKKSPGRGQEQGGFFVLHDNDGAFADEPERKFINYLLQPVELLSQTQLPDEYARILSIAQGMLPQWNHRPVDFGKITAPFNLRQLVIISTFQQPVPRRFASCLNAGIFAPKYGSTHLTALTASRGPLRTSGSATLCSIPSRFRHFWNGWLPPRCLQACLKPSDKT
jgi:hypothetical protein